MRKKDNARNRSISSLRTLTSEAVLLILSFAQFDERASVWTIQMLRCCFINWNSLFLLLSFHFFFFPMASVSLALFFVLLGGKDANVLFHRYFQNRCHKRRRRRERKRMQICFDIHRSVNGWMFVFCSRCQHWMVTHRGNEEKWGRERKSFSRLPPVNDRIICTLKNIVSAVATRWRWQVRETTLSSIGNNNKLFENALIDQVEFSSFSLHQWTGRNCKGKEKTVTESQTG